MPLSLRRLLGLFACRLGCGGEKTVFSSLRAGCVAISCLPIGPSRLSPRFATRWAVRRAIDACYPFSVPISCRLPRPRVCLPRGVPAPVPRSVLMWMATGGWRSVGSACCLLSCPVVSVPFRPLVSSLPFHGLFDWCGSVPFPDVVGMSSGAIMPCRASSRPPRLSSVVCDELIKTARTEMTFSLPPPFRFPAICVSPRPALLPVASCRGAGRDD